MIRLYTGNGCGKTTSALGVAMRCLGHGKKVVMIQFMKGRKDIGEYKIQNKLKNFRVYQFGRECFIKNQPAKEDYALAEKGLSFAEKVLKQKKFLVILDEVNLAAKFGLLSKNKVVKALKNKNKKTNVILTGRYAPKEFMDISDIVTVFEEKKRRKMKAEKGIEY